MEVDSEPTDLSLPKKRRAEDDSVLIPKKIIARSLSLALPAVPSPQPKPSPQPSDHQINNLLPAHQQKPLSKSVFLESLLSSPKKCHQTPVVHSSANNVQPLNLGAQVNRNVRSPTVSCSEDKKPFARSSEESQEQPKAKCQKVEDITLKNLLSRKPKLSLKPPRHTVSSEVKPTIKKQELDQFSEATRKEKSRLLELLTSEPASVTTTSLPHDLDPLAQLKTVLSDPNITVPDPLLVPRDRLQELVASPGREIPRLLTVRPELRLPDILAYPSLLQDPDLLVVSLQHLQKILQKTGNSFNEAEAMANSTLGAFLEWQWYQHQQMAAASEIMDSQRKHQERKSAELLANDMDAATTAALNQMLWLSHLEAAAALASRDNNSDFLSMLNAMLPKTLSPPASRQHSFGPGFVSPSPPGVPRSADYKNQLEFQQTLALWQKVMSQPNSPGALSPGNRHLKTNPAANNHVKNLTNNKLSNGEKMNSSSARTSPISPNVHQHRPAGNNGACARSGEFLQVPQPFPYNHHRQQHQPPPAGQNHTPKPPKSEFPPINASTKSAVTCKSLLNLLSNQRRHHGHKLQQEPAEPPHGTLLSALGKPPANAQGNPASSPIPRLLPIPQGGGTPMDLSGSYDAMHSSPVSKLKVKKYLVDPNNKPRLLKAELAPALVSPTGAVRMEDLPLQTAALWHPLFGRAYSSPVASLVLTDSSQLTSDSQHLGIYRSPVASLVLTDSSQLTSDSQHLAIYERSLDSREIAKSELNALRSDSTTRFLNAIL
uniref:Uncharacterized protein n=1 Tax=Timema shepardi TaxID=629360 RepID=A0A7R9G325_TIMSH|nr:unnamed protein product [Timema shepardi]